MAGGSLADDGCPEELAALIEHDLFNYTCFADKRPTL